MFVIAIDGRSGAGKTDLAARLSRRCDAPVLHLENHYAGWRGLSVGINHGRTVLDSLRAGDVGTAPRWDWIEETDGPLMNYEPAPVWIVEGVGAGALRDRVDLLIWVEAPDDVRKERALTRDGDSFAPWWDLWAAQEQDYLDRVNPRDSADIVHVAE